MDDWFEEMTFTYKNSQGETTTHTVRGENGLFLAGVEGPTVDKAFTNFLKGTGFAYVEGVEFIKEGDE